MEPSIYFQAIAALLDVYPTEKEAKVLETASLLNSHIQNKHFYKSCVDFVRSTPAFVSKAQEFTANFVALTTNFSEFPTMTKLAKEISEIVKVRTDNERLQIKAVDGTVSLIATEPLCAEDLDRVQASKCGDPECTLDHSQMPAVLSTPCHPGAPMFLTYKDGIVVTHCCVCRREAFALRIESRS